MKLTHTRIGEFCPCRAAKCDAPQQLALEVIDATGINVMLRRKMMQSNKGGAMEIIYTAFLIGTVAMTLMIAIDQN